MNTDYIREYKMTMTAREVGTYDAGEYQITSPSSVTKLMEDMYDLPLATEEYMILITVNTKYVIDGVFSISHGTTSASLVHPSDIFKRVWMNNSTGFVLVHNHPSGNPTPSPQDDQVTERIKSASDIMGVNFLDHIIIGRMSQYSYKEEGQIV